MPRRARAWTGSLRDRRSIDPAGVGDPPGLPHQPHNSEIESQFQVPAYIRLKWSVNRIPQHPADLATLRPEARQWTETSAAKWC